MLRKSITKIITVIVIYLAFNIAYVHKLLRLTPWIGADTYPIYPCTLIDTAGGILSPWSFYLGRSVIDGGLPYLGIIKCMFYHLFGTYAELAFVVFWLTIAGLGFFMLSKLLTSNAYVKVIAGLLYIVSIFTWHEAVHSIYGMLGVYAITPWIYCIMLLSLRRLELSPKNSSRKSLIVKIVMLYLIGYALGMLAISTLFAYYPIYILFLWFPLVLTLLIVHLVIKRLKLGLNLLGLLLMLLGFLTPYVMSYLSMEVSSLEYIGLKTSQKLLNVKLADFSYNYRFNNAPLWIWLSYLWSKALLFYSNEMIVAPIIIQGAILSYVTYRLARIRQYKLPYATIYLNSIISLTFLIGFIIFATHIASIKNTELLKRIWSLPLVAILLSGITQPIKLGIPISFYEALVITLFMTELVRSNIRCKGKHLSHYLMRAAILVIVLIAILSAITYGQNLPVTKNNYVINEYMESLKLQKKAIKTFDTINSPYMFQPYVIVAPGKHFFRYYYTYAVAQRPYKPFGAYVRGGAPYKDVIELFERITVNRTSNVVADIIAKTFYISTYISKSRNVVVFNYTKSPIYIVIPVKIIPTENSTKDYMLVLTALASLIAKDKDLAIKYLYSYAVLDFIPFNAETPTIYIEFVKEGNLRKLKHEYINNIANPVILINNSINDVICPNDCMLKLRNVINYYSSLNVAWTSSLLPLRIKTYINTHSESVSLCNTCELVLRFNEHYSPYWGLLDKNSNHTYSLTGYNIFLAKDMNVEKAYLIQHKLWFLQMIFTSVKLLMLVLLLLLLLKRK